MCRRLLTIGLVVAVLMGGRAAAKPPDLPLPQNDTLAPAPPPVPMEATPYVFPQAAAPAAPATEAPLFFRLRPSVRRSMASCLLFTVNPLLALAPTADYLDFDEEDASHSAFLALFDLSAWENNALDVTGGHGCLSSEAKPAREGAWSTPSVCPYMRQLQCGAECPTAQCPDIDLSHDVLDNLEMLRQAQTLLQDAKELGSAGRVCEAMDCLELAHDLCPGGWLDPRIAESSAEVFAASCCESGKGAAAEEQPEPPARHAIEHKLLQAVSVRFDGTPLRQVLDDLRAWQGINLYVDKAALDEEEVSLDQPVTVKLENVSLKSALHLILESVHLNYVVKDEVLEITTERVAPRHRIQLLNEDILVRMPDGSPTVDALLQQCHAAMDAGQTCRAVVLARQAFAADPEQAAADPLVYKMQLIGDAPAPAVRPAPKQAASSASGRHEARPQSSESVSLRPCLPPVDSQLRAALEDLYPESSHPIVQVSAEEPEPAPPVEKGQAKPFVNTADLEEVGRAKNGGAPISCLEALKEFAAVAPPGQGDLFIGLDGSVRVFTQIRRGGAVWHLEYNNGSLSVWASPDGGADAGSPAGKPGDDDSGDR